MTTKSHPLEPTMWDSRLKLLLTLGAVVAMIWAAILAMNATYTQATEFNAHAQHVEKELSGHRALILQFDLRDLKKQLYEIEEAADARGGRMTPADQRRKKELQDEIETVKSQIDGLKKEAK
jgi:hypothetical protein